MSYLWLSYSLMPTLRCYNIWIKINAVIMHIHNALACSSAWSTVLTNLHFWVVIPNLSINSLLWYSWMFKLRRIILLTFKTYIHQVNNINKWVKFSPYSSCVEYIQAELSYNKQYDATWRYDQQQTKELKALIVVIWWSKENTRKQQQQ